MKTMPVASEPKRALVMQQSFQHLARGFVGTDRFFGTHRHMSVAKANSFLSPHGESANTFCFVEKQLFRRMYLEARDQRCLSVSPAYHLITR